MPIAAGYVAYCNTLAKLFHVFHGRSSRSYCFACTLTVCGSLDVCKLDLLAICRRHLSPMYSCLHVSSFGPFDCKCVLGKLAV
jgi:hypothetical protein